MCKNTTTNLCFLSCLIQTDYKDARRVCQTLYGTNFGLAAIQTEEDLKALNAFLQEHEVSRELHTDNFSKHFP